VQIGTFLPTYWLDYGAAGERRAIEETARAAQSLGFDSVWANDHLIAPASHSEMGHIIEPLITLAAIMHLVPDLRLGTSTLVLPQRNAILVAKQVAALDVLSGGRFIRGVGVGWLEGEFAYLNADFSQRGRVADEAIVAMRTLWRDSPASFRGQFYDFAQAVVHPKPLAGRVPIWVCGNTPAAIRRAAGLGDAWNPFGISVPDFAAGAAAIRASAAGSMPLLAAHLRIRIGGPASDQVHLAGDADEVAAMLLAYQRAGLAYLICDFVADGLEDLLRQMQTMAEQIAPALTEPLAE
jgi:probable F420-dependent oxidoreductase